MKIALLHNSRLISNFNTYCKLCGTITTRWNHTERKAVVDVGLESPAIVLPEHNRLDMLTLSHALGNLRPSLVNKQLLSKTPLPIRLCDLENLRLRSSENQDSVESVILETPLTVLPIKDHVDMIGPPNSVSKLRPIIRFKALNETPRQRKLRKFQDETQEWNEKFWSTHNLKFQKERENFIKLRLKGDTERTTLSSDEMSEFYKSFLDENWKTHLQYNFQWYKHALYKKKVSKVKQKKTNLEREYSHIIDKARGLRQKSSVYNAICREIGSFVLETFMIINSAIFNVWSF